jgi:hypothetical protein
MAFIYIACVTATASAEFATKQQKITSLWFNNGHSPWTGCSDRVSSCFKRIKGNGFHDRAGRQNR